MKRILLLAICAAITNCATTAPEPVTQEVVFKRTKTEIDKRENWSEEPYVLARQVSTDGKQRWLVQVDLIDCSRHTECGCALFKPGYGRELVFSESGRLLSYKSR